MTRFLNVRESSLLIVFHFWLAKFLVPNMTCLSMQFLFVVKNSKEWCMFLHDSNRTTAFFTRRCCDNPFPPKPVKSWSWRWRTFWAFGTFPEVNASKVACKIILSYPFLRAKAAKITGGSWRCSLICSCIFFPPRGYVCLCPTPTPRKSLFIGFFFKPRAAKGGKRSGLDLYHQMFWLELHVTSRFKPVDRGGKSDVFPEDVEEIPTAIF